jgi:hypothetical protein
MTTVWCTHCLTWTEPQLVVCDVCPSCHDVATWASTLAEARHGWQYDIRTDAWVSPAGRTVTQMQLHLRATGPLPGQFSVPFDWEHTRPLRVGDVIRVKLPRRYHSVIRDIPIATGHGRRDEPLTDADKVFLRVQGIKPE